MRKEGGRLEKFIGKKLQILHESHPWGEGTVESSFGSTGKFNLRLGETKMVEENNVHAFKLVLKYQKLVVIY